MAIKSRAIKFLKTIRSELGLFLLSGGPVKPKYDDWMIINNEIIREPAEPPVPIFNDSP